MRAVLLGAALVVAWSAPARAQSPGAESPLRTPEPEPATNLLTPSPPTPAGADVPLLKRFVPGLADALKEQTPFFRDTKLNLHPRSFYLNRQNSDDSANEAWAFGGWLAYKSGWLLDTVALGAVGYTSQPLYAPDNTPGTLLLQPPDQDTILVLGQLYLQLKYQEYIVVTGYRQQVDEGYVNPQDNRMIPNTFEGVTLTGTLGPIGYNVGYLTSIKTRAENSFRNPATVAGVTGEDRGLILTRLSSEPIKGLTLYAANYYVEDVFNTTYGKVEYKYDITSDLGVDVGLQYTDQRAVGADFLGPFNTWNVGTGARVRWRGLTVATALSATGDQKAIQSPYGTFPGYLSYQERDFNRAREKAWGAGVKYDFDAGTLLPFRIPGVTALMKYAQGSDAHDKSTGGELPNVKEVDYDITWNVPWVKGLQFRFRNAYLDDGGDKTVRSFRLILNYEIPLL